MMTGGVMTDHEKRICEARWYSVDKSGAATLCTGQDDAIATATTPQALRPNPQGNRRRSRPS